MRDLRRIKSKYEFKLDNKQIAFLLVGVLIVLVVVFALGVVVGKGLVQIQTIEAGLELQQQVEVQVPEVPDFDLDTEGDAMLTPTEPVPGMEGYENILTDTTPPFPTDAGAPATGDTPDYVPVSTPEPTPEPSPSGGNFTIQLSAHPNKLEADQRKKSYEAQGLTNVYLVTADVKGQTWYRVRSGAFATKDGAQEFANAIKAKGIVANPWVTTK